MPFVFKFMHPSAKNKNISLKDDLQTIVLILNVVRLNRKVICEKGNMKHEHKALSSFIQNPISINLFFCIFYL
jgi:hypothetical protein